MEQLLQSAPIYIPYELIGGAFVLFSIEYFQAETLQNMAVAFGTMFSICFPMAVIVGLLTM